jgi:hypothetical protein
MAILDRLKKNLQHGGLLPGAEAAARLVEDQPIYQIGPPQGTGYDLARTAPIVPAAQARDRDVARRYASGPSITESFGSKPRIDPRQTTMSFTPGEGPAIRSSGTGAGASGSWGARVGASGFWGDEPMQQEESEFDVSATTKQGVLDIDPVVDRYAKMYEEATTAIDRFNRADFVPRGRDTRSYDPTKTGSSVARAKYSSPERGALLKRQRQAFELLQGGSFADTANIKKQQRQMQAAHAQQALRSSELTGKEVSHFDRLLAGEEDAAERPDLMSPEMQEILRGLLGGDQAQKKDDVAKYGMQLL